MIQLAVNIAILALQCLILWRSWTLQQLIDRTVGMQNRSISLLDDRIEYLEQRISVLEGRPVTTPFRRAIN